MNVLLAWPDWTMRADRCVMFSWLAEWAEQVHLITSARLPDDLVDQLHPQCKILYVDHAVRGMRFVRAAGRAAVNLLRSSYSQDMQCVFQELAVARLVPQAYLGRWLPRRQFRSVLSLYSPNPSNWRNRTWRTNRGHRLTPRQEWVHSKIILIRMLTEMLSVRVVDSVIGNSEEVMRDAIEFYKKNRRFVHFYPGEVDTTYFQPAESQRAEPPVILFLGYLHARKGIYDLLDAVQILRKRGLAVRLKMMGASAIEARDVQQAITDRQLVEVVDMLPRQPRETVREALQTATLLALPSYTEGSPRVVKEAMACGCPVVVTDLPGTRFLDPSQRALSFVPVGDTCALSEAIAHLLIDDDHRKKLGQQGRVLAEENFGAPRVARKMFEMYQSLFEEDYFD